MPAAIPAATATPPPHTPTQQPSSPASSSSTKRTPISLLTKGGWSPTTFRVEVDAPAGLLLLKQQAPQQDKQQQQRLVFDGEGENEECVAMVDLKSVGAARLCSEQEAGGAGSNKGEGAKEEEGERGAHKNVVNVEVGGKALVMRVESEAAAGELLAAVAGGKAAAILSDSAEKANNNDDGGSADRGARRAAAAAAAAAMRRRRANNSAGGQANNTDTDPVRFLGSYTPSSPGPFQQPPPPASQTPTTPTIARVNNASNNGASPGTAAFVAERRLLQQQRQREKERLGVKGAGEGQENEEEEEGVEVFYKAKKSGDGDGDGDGEEDGPSQPVALTEIIEKSHEALPSPSTRSVRSTHSTSTSQRILSVSDSLRSLRSGAGSEELEEGLKSLQEDHRARSSSFRRSADQSSSSSLSVAAGAPTAGSRAPRACCVVQ